MYFRARYYNSLTGEFLSRDPMQFVDGMSLYRGYFANVAVDPAGMIIPAAAVWKFVGILFRNRLIISAAGAFGFGVGSGAAYDNAVSSDIPWAGIPWGSFIGQEVLDNYNEMWNDKGAGDAPYEFCDCNEKQYPCNEAGEKIVTMERYSATGVFGITQWSHFKLKLRFSFNGCDITSINFYKEADSGGFWSPQSKMAVVGIKTVNRKVDPNLCLHARVKDGNLAADICCKPVCLDIQVALEGADRNALSIEGTPYPFARSAWFTICGSGIGLSNGEGPMLGEVR